MIQAGPPRAHLGYKGIRSGRWRARGAAEPLDVAVPQPLEPASNSLAPMFRPRGVAVIGASRQERSIGNTLVRNLVGKGFAGTVFPVNPQAASVQSVKCHPDVRDIEDPVDLAVVAVPAPLVLAVVEACCAKGVKAVCVVSAGFAET